MRICEGIIAKGLDVSWACRTRVDLVDRELLRAMKRAGCARIYYGIECGNQAVLSQSGKGITLDEVRQVIAMTKHEGILTLGFFLIGAAHDTVSSIEQTIAFAVSLDLDYAQFHKVMAKPASKLYDIVRNETGKDYWRDYILGTAREERLPSPWTEVSQEEIERLTIRAYRRFYFRPSRLLKIALGIKSSEELLRYIRSAVGLLFVKSDVS